MEENKKYKCIICWTKKLYKDMAADYVCKKCLKGKITELYHKE